MAATAQEVRLGSLEGNSQVFTGTTPITIIDWSRPSTASGTVNTASVAWTDASSPCDGIFYVRFFIIPSNGFAAVMTDERGPFKAVNGVNTVTLTPPVPVTSETYIGIRRGAGPSTCGQPYGTFTRQPGHALFTSDDFKGGAFASLQPSNNYRLQAQASNTPSVRVATLPVVGATAGSGGSFFRTSLTLSNPSSFTITGKLMLRLAGRAGTDTDPAINYSIPANGTLNYADILGTIGQTGLGSLDVLTTASPTPIATARVFSDAGAAGTSGLSEESVPAGSDYLSLGAILIPDDLTNFRLNVGIRTFSAGDLTVAVYDAAGSRVSTTTRSYAANFFEQIPAAAFIGTDPPAGGKIVVSAFQKDFIVYGAVTDNRTQDPSMRIGSD